MYSELYSAQTRSWWGHIDIITLHYITLHYITLHYRHFKRHLHLKWPVVHQQLHAIRNTAHRPSTQASYTASRVRPKRKISCAAAQIASALTISFPRWRHMSLTSYWGQQRMSLTSYPVLTYSVMLHLTIANKFMCSPSRNTFWLDEIRTRYILNLWCKRCQATGSLELKGVVFPMVE